MSSNAPTRRAREAAGYCSACLVRPRVTRMSVCAECRESLRSASVERYRVRRANGRCTRCDRPTGTTGTRRDPPECETCLAKRRKRRSNAHPSRSVGGNPGHDLPVGTYRGVRRP